MKIYNLILLNFYFLQLFSLLFGMDLLKDSGAQQTEEHEAFMQLSGKILTLLDEVGDSDPCPGIEVRPLYNRSVKPITNVTRQCLNLFSAFNDLFKQTDVFNRRLKSYLDDKEHYKDDQNLLVTINKEINLINIPLQTLKEHKQGIMVDMEKIYNYLSELNNQAIIKEDHSITVTSRQNQHGPSRPRQRKRKRGKKYPKSD